MSIPASLAERYRVERELGVGALVTTYLAEDVRDHRKVGVRVLRSDLDGPPDPERFREAIEPSVAIRHANILPILDAGAADGQMYFVVPYIEVETLRERLARDRRLPLAEAVRLAREIADALAYAHGRSVVHGHLTPGSVLLQHGHALVPEFGVLPAIDRAMGRIGADQRDDIHALGAIAYEMIAGDRPGVATPPPLSQLRPGVPDYIEAAIATALQPRPEDRFATVREFTTAMGDGSELSAPGSRPSAGRSEPMAEGRGRRVIPWALTAFFLASTVWAWLRCA